MIKEIKLTSLFGEKVERGQRLVKEKRISGDTPLVTAGEQNQGIAENICADGHTVYDNAITIDMFGNAFCRDYKFCADDNILILKNPAFSYNTLLYLAAAINKKSSRYSYAQQYRQKSYVAETIFLPVKTVFTPDYAMIENLAGGGIDMSNIDTSTWKEFSLDELFEISTTKSQNKNAITFDDNGIYDFIGRSSVNYGIQGHLNRQEYEPNPAKVFSLVQVGESVCLYRENEWYASQNIYMLKPKDKRICAAHNFFETLINKQLLIYTSAYIYPCLEDIKKIKILLPRKETEDIDFDFMEKYIHAIEKQTIARVYEGRGKIIKKTKEIVSEKTM